MDSHNDTRASACPRSICHPYFLGGVTFSIFDQSRLEREGGGGGGGGGGETHRQTAERERERERGGEGGTDERTDKQTAYTYTKEKGYRTNLEQSGI